MTVFEILRDVQDARARVELWGVNFRALFWIGAGASLAMLLALRQILSWYLKIDRLRAELGELRREVGELRQNLR